MALAVLFAGGCKTEPEKPTLSQEAAEALRGGDPRIAWAILEMDGEPLYGNGVALAARDAIRAGSDHQMLAVMKALTSDLVVIGCARDVAAVAALIPSEQSAAILQGCGKGYLPASAVRAPIHRVLVALVMAWRGRVRGHTEHDWHDRLVRGVLASDP
ncbi:MAG: hypothetical protein ACI9WU_002711 [Myxococcota bacterium]|jgi:hypothetical protein